MSQRKIYSEHKALTKRLLQHYQPKYVSRVHKMLKDLLGDTLQKTLEA